MRAACADHARERNGAPLRPCGHRGAQGRPRGGSCSILGSEGCPLPGSTAPQPRSASGTWVTPSWAGAGHPVGVTCHRVWQAPARGSKPSVPWAGQEQAGAGPWQQAQSREARMTHRLGRGLGSPLLPATGARDPEQLQARPSVAPGLLLGYRRLLSRQQWETEPRLALHGGACRAGGGKHRGLRVPGSPSGRGHIAPSVGTSRASGALVN